MNIARGHLDVIGQTFLCIEDVKPDEHTEVEEKQINCCELLYLSYGETHNAKVNFSFYLVLFPPSRAQARLCFYCGVHKVKSKMGENMNR
jgi:hypothetical protein